MDNRLAILKLSEKVKAYVEEVERETGYTVQINDWRGNGAQVTLDHEHKQIDVDINEEEHKNESEEEIDYTIAHEVTHEFLSLKKKYCRTKSTLENRMIMKRIAGMIEDIVVDKIIQEKNYRTSYSVYLNDVRKDIQFIRKSVSKNKDFFKLNKNDSKYRLELVIAVFGYIVAWSDLEYFKWDKFNRKLLHKYLKIIQKSCPEQYEVAEKVKNIILNNDIFAAKGYDEAIKQCLDLFNLTNEIIIYHC